MFVRAPQCLAWCFRCRRACLTCVRSIYENITYGLEEGEFTEEDVYAAAKQACAHDFISGFAGESRVEVHADVSQLL